MLNLYQKFQEYWKSKSAKAKVILAFVAIILYFNIGYALTEGMIVLSQTPPNEYNLLKEATLIGNSPEDLKGWAEISLGYRMVLNAMWPLVTVIIVGNIVIRFIIWKLILCGGLYKIIIMAALTLT